MNLTAQPSSSLRGMIALYAGSLLAGAWTMIIPIIPVLAKHFGISPGAAAQIVTAMAIGRFCGTPISGVLLDRMGVRAVLIGGALLTSVAALIAAFAPLLSIILVLAVFMGIGDSIWALGREVGGIDLARQNQRGRVLSTLHGTHNAGTALCPYIGGLLTETFGFWSAFAGYGLLTGVSVLLGSLMPKAQSPAAQDPTPLTSAPRGSGMVQRLRGFRDLFHQIKPELRSTYVALVFATLASHSYRVTMHSMLPLYAGSYLHFSPSRIGLLFTIAGAFVFAMIVPAGFLMDKVGRKWATVPSTGLPALAFLLIPFTESFAQLAVLVALTGICNGLSLGSMSVSTFDVVPASVRGRLQAARRMIAEMGGALAPALGGFLANAFNPGVPFLVYVPILLAAAIFLAVVGKETLKQ